MTPSMDNGINTAPALRQIKQVRYQLAKHFTGSARPYYIRAAMRGTLDRVEQNLINDPSPENLMEAQDAIDSIAAAVISG